MLIRRSGRNLQLGSNVQMIFDAVALVSKALGRQFEVTDSVGMNATFGVRIVLFAPNPLITDEEVVDDYNQEEMYQVSCVPLDEEVSG